MAGCATPATAPTATPTEGAVTATATAVLPASVPTAVPTDTPTFTPTASPTPEPTNTSTAVPTYTLSGTVFFDYNGNGLRDEGEPPVEGVAIRVAGLRTTSAPDGSYSLAGMPAGSQQVYVQSPTQEPATAFRYINKLLGWVDIAAYEMNGVSVAAQRLPDTEVQPMDQPLVVNSSEGLSFDVALMQGLLTLPFIRSQVPDPFIWNYFDVLNNQLVCESIRRDGVSLSYDGTYNQIGDPFVPVAGAGDAHTGLDYAVPVGKYVLHAAPTSVVFLIADEVVHTMFPDPDDPGRMVKNTYSHLDRPLVELNQTVHRGQIVALSGDSGEDNTFPGYGTRKVPQLHFDLSLTTPERCTQYLDPYRTTFAGPYPGGYSGSEVSYWTVDNSPRFP